MREKALITGANGMLADAFCPLLEKKGYKVYATDIASGNGILKLDIRDLAEIRDAFSAGKPDIVFHLAAETDVDKCELNPEHAYSTNAKGTENIAHLCREYDIPMVYVSTGAVFDGEKEGGYTEEDNPGKSVNIYGMSKLEGERIVKSLLEKYYIVRASWMIGGLNKDKKFVWKITQLLKTQKEIPVVIDKWGSPTFTKDFAKGLIDIVETGKHGTYHCVSKGICTRFDIAKKIALYMGKKDTVLKPVTSDAFPLPAPRPKSEALLNYNLKRLNMDNGRPWEEVLKEYIEEMK